MCICDRVRDVLLRYLDSHDAIELVELVSAHPEIISMNYGDYPDVHRMMDLMINGVNFRVCRQISKKENITLTPVGEISNVPGVPLWLTGEKLILWAKREEESPSDGPIDWNQYR